MIVLNVGFAQRLPFCVPDKRFANDVIIADIVWQGDMVLVTCNVKDFTGIDAQLLNPWEWSR